MKKNFDEFPLEIKNFDIWEELFVGIDIMQLFSIRTSMPERREAFAELTGKTRSWAQKRLEKIYPANYSRDEKPTRKEMRNNLCYFYRNRWVVVSYEVLKVSTDVDLGQMRENQLKNSRVNRKK